ncbi:MAG: hypothetical protein EBY17_12365 [Acidobacteriia bacterium]|nr:hypothetical protein [Terriglobia bacterium]
MPVLAVKAIIYRIGPLILVAFGCCVLIALSVQGYQNAMRNTTDLQTTAQYLMTISQFLYSALGPCVVILRFVRLEWLSAVWRAWALFFVTAVALIPWAWIEPSLLQTVGYALVGSVAAGLLSLLVFCGAQAKIPQDVAAE